MCWLMTLAAESVYCLEIGSSQAVLSKIAGAMIEVVPHYDD
jgi:hypothetical protein